MLVVISIILIVAVAALPAISSLSKSAARRSSVSLVMAALDQARAQALTQSANCYFVFANGDPRLVFSTGRGRAPEDYRYRAFAVFQEVYLPPAPGASAEDAARPYHLLPIRPWTLLPEGVAFRPKEAPPADGAPGLPRTIFNVPKLTRAFFCQPANAEMELPFFKFNATGAIEDPTASDLARVKIFEGYVTENGGSVTTNAAKAKADETIVLSLFTGRARREEINVAN